MTLDIDGVSRLVLDAVVVASVPRVVAAVLVSPHFAKKRLFSDDMSYDVFLFVVGRNRRRTIENFVADRIPESFMVAAQVSAVFLLLLASFATDGFVFFARRRIVRRRITVVEIAVVVVIFVVAVVVFVGRVSLLVYVVVVLVHLATVGLVAVGVCRVGTGRIVARLLLRLHCTFKDVFGLVGSS